MKRPAKSSHNSPSCCETSGGNIREAKVRLKMSENSLSKPPIPIWAKSQLGLMILAPTKPPPPVPIWAAFPMRRRVESGVRSQVTIVLPVRSPNWHFLSPVSMDMPERKMWKIWTTVFSKMKVRLTITSSINARRCKIRSIWNFMKTRPTYKKLP